MPLNDTPTQTSLEGGEAEPCLAVVLKLGSCHYLIFCSSEEQEVHVELMAGATEMEYPAISFYL